LGTLYVERQREMKYSESATIITRSKDRSNHLGTLKDRDNPSVTQEGHMQVLGLGCRESGSWEEMFRRSGTQVDFQSFAAHDLHESDGKSKSAKSCAKDLAKDESSTWTRNDDTKDDRRSAVNEEGDITWNSNPKDRTLPGAENQSNMMA
jgi:hypothetical protein